MKQIDVSDLPEPIARNLARQAEHYRELEARKRNGHAKPLPQWPGAAPSPEELRRENLYDDDE